MFLRTFLSSLLDVIFPARRERGRLWEAMTAERFEASAARAAQDAVLSRLGATALFSYNDPLVRDALHALKYDGERSLAALFGQLLAEHLKEGLAEQTLLAGDAPLLVPIPVTFGRHIERSYNQTELLAREVAERLPDAVSYAPDILTRSAFRGSQTGTSSRRERSANVRGAFTVTEPGTLSGRDVILLDDVITTGATTDEAAATLLSAGARNVFPIAVAH
jgi:ComF family protein